MLRDVVQQNGNVGGVQHGAEAIGYALRGRVLVEEGGQDKGGVRAHACRMTRQFNGVRDAGRAGSRDQGQIAPVRQGGL